MLGVVSTPSANVVASEVIAFSGGPPAQPLTSPGRPTYFDCQPEPVRVGQRLENQGPLLGFLGTQGRGLCRGAAGFIRGRLEYRQQFHVPIMP